MKKNILLVLLMLTLLIAGTAAGQGFPDILSKKDTAQPSLPDPADFLSGEGQLLAENYFYYGVVYNAYYYPLPDAVNEFAAAYFFAAAQAGFEPELAVVDGNSAIKVYSPGKTGDPALLLYDYQGHVMLMVPLDMPFALESRDSESNPGPTVVPPTATMVLPTLTSTPMLQPTAAPMDRQITPNAAPTTPPGFEIDSDGVLVKYTGSAANVVIPDGVKSISSFAFSENKSIKSILISDGVLQISAYAFSSMENLESVVISDSVMTIDEYAFYNCTSLKNVSFGEGLMLIGDSAFDECTGLKTITIPGSVQVVGESAFWGCSNLETIVFEEGVRVIGSYAFQACDRIKQVTLPESLIFIGRGALNTYRSGPTYNYKPNSYADFWLSGSNSNNDNSYGDFRIEENGELTEYTGNAETIVIPENVVSIGSFVFDENTAVKSIIIPEGVSYISSYAFSSCPNLESVTIPGSLIAIGTNAFYQCTSLKNVIINEGVQFIGSEAFQYNSALESISLPESVVLLGDSAFYNCSSLTNVSLADGLQLIGNQAFRGCSALSSLMIPDSVRFIDSRAVPGDITVTRGQGSGSSSAPRMQATATPHPTRTPLPTNTPTKVPPTKTPAPTFNLYSAFDKYVVSGAGLYGFQIRPYPNTEWLYKEQYQHPVYNGDVVYFTGKVEMGQGYNGDNIKWYSVITDDGFTGWLPAYILKRSN